MWSGGKVNIISFFFFLTKFFKKLFMFKIFYMVVLGNSVKFSPNLSKFSRRDGRGGGGGGEGVGEVGVTFLTNLSEISFFLRGIAKYVT